MATASAPYDFDAFLTSMAPLDYIEILRRADAECARAEKGSSGRGGLRDRKLVDVTYARRVREFLFFMRHRTNSAARIGKRRAPEGGHHPGLSLGYQPGPIEFGKSARARPG
jgi:hypothetical protein